MMGGNILTGAECLELSCKCFQFVLDRIFEPGVECIGLPACVPGGACSKTSALHRFTHKKFEFEERMMRTSGYPDFRAHAFDHLRLISLLEVGPGTGECRDWMSWIRDIADDWTRNHLIHHDHSFKEWVG